MAPLEFVFIKMPVPFHFVVPEQFSLIKSQERKREGNANCTEDDGGFFCVLDVRIQKVSQGAAPTSINLFLMF